MQTTHQLKPDNILLAVDGSPSARGAANAAIKIAAAMGWKLCAQYVVDVTQVFEAYADTTRELSELGDDLPDAQRIKLFEEQGTLALAEIEGLCQEMGVRVTTEMIFGGIPDVILESATRYSLLALGRRGNSHKQDKHHLGGNFRQIAHHSHTPLLVGADVDMPRTFQRLLLAYDGSALARMALTWAEVLQPMFTEVLVLSVKRAGEKDPTWLDARQNEITESALDRYDFIDTEGEPAQMIASVASTRQADLIVMGAYQHRKLPEWARHSILDSVLHQVGIPVLAIKQAEGMAG